MGAAAGAPSRLAWHAWPALICTSLAASRANSCTQSRVCFGGWLTPPLTAKVRSPSLLRRPAFPRLETPTAPSSRAWHPCPRAERAEGPPPPGGRRRALQMPDRRGTPAHWTRAPCPAACWASRRFTRPAPWARPAARSWSAPPSAWRRTSGSRACRCVSWARACGVAQSQGDRASLVSTSQLLHPPHTAAKPAPKERRKAPLDQAAPPLEHRPRDFISTNVQEAAAAAPKYQEQEEVLRLIAGMLEPVLLPPSPVRHVHVLFIPSSHSSGNAGPTLHPPAPRCATCSRSTTASCLPTCGSARRSWRRHGRRRSRRSRRTRWVLCGGVGPRLDAARCAQPAAQEIPTCNHCRWPPCSPTLGGGAGHARHQRRRAGRAHPPPEAQVRHRPDCCGPDAGVGQVLGDSRLAAGGVQPAVPAPLTLCRWQDINQAYVRLPCVMDTPSKKRRKEVRPFCAAGSAVGYAWRLPAALGW